MTDRHRFPISLFRLLDVFLLIASFGISTILLVHTRGRASLTQFLSMRTRISNVLIFALALFLCHLVFKLCGLYQSRRLSSRRAELIDVLKANTVAVGCFTLVASSFTVAMITANFLAVFWTFNMILLGGSRLILRLVLARMRSEGRNIRHMLVLGTNPRAVEFAQKLIDSPQRGYRLLGFVDDDWLGLADFARSNYPLVSDFAGLKDFLRSNVVDEITIFLPVGSLYVHCNQVAELCQQHGIVMRFNSDLFGLKAARRSTEEFDGEHFVTAATRVPEGLPVAIKRILDVVVSSTLLLFLSPILIASALAIKFTSPGSILFLQERIGQNKRRFTIVKLRTMVVEAENMMAKLEQQNEVSGPVFKMKNDPRITNVGKFLRASSIDELPQLLNVLKGDMSLVGPRPLPVRDFEGFNLDWQRRRFSVKPGITCLWQVMGRSSISFDQWMMLDIQYMDEWSLWLDIKILFQTIPAVLRGSGAM